MIRNLIFDFGKVLVDYDFFILLDQLFPTHEEAEDFYRHLMDDNWNERFDCEAKPLEEIVSDMQLAMPQYKEQIRQFLERYTEFVIGEMPGMRQLLMKFKNEGYKLYGLTNWCSKVHETMSQYPIFQLLDGRIISSEEHVVKPSQEIYERLCTRFGIKPEECVFADDKPENVEAARRFGMHAICFRDAAGYETELKKILSEEGKHHGV